MEKFALSGHKNVPKFAKTCYNVSVNFKTFATTLRFIG